MAAATSNVIIVLNKRKPIKLLNTNWSWFWTAAYSLAKWSASLMIWIYQSSINVYTNSSY